MKLRPKPECHDDRAAIFRAALRDDFGMFARRCFRELHPGKKLDDNWHIDALLHHFDEVRLGVKRRSIVNAPPRSLKSELASIILPAWALGHDPTMRIICISYDRELANKFGRATRLLMLSDFYGDIFPDAKLKKKVEHLLETTLGGGRQAASFESGITGHGATMIIIDDPLTPPAAMSASARQKVIDFYSGSLRSRLDVPETGRIMVVMQRVHEDDLTGYLLRKGGFERLCLPAIAPADMDVPMGRGRIHHWKEGELLHPSHLSVMAIGEYRQDLTASMFSAQLMQEPIPQDGDIVKAAWIKRYTTPPDRGAMRIVQSWDTAIKGSPSSDYSVCTTWGELNNEHYLLDVYRRKVDNPQLIEDAVTLHARFSPSYVLVEGQGSGSMLCAFLKDRHQIVATELRFREDKETRLNRVTPMFEKGQVILPQHASWLGDYELELFGFPGARYDDQVDSTSQYLNWAHERSSKAVFNFDFGYEPTVHTPETLMDLLAEHRWS